MISRKNPSIDPILKNTNSRWYYIISFAILIVGIIGTFSAQRNIYRNDIKTYSTLLEETAHNTELQFSRITSIINLMMFSKNSIQRDCEFTNDINTHLTYISKIPGISEAYILDTAGTCIYSSTPGFLNKSYTFRPYFKDAIENGSGFYGALGTVSNEVGVYYSTAISNNKETAVAVIKLKPSFFAITSPEITLSYENKENALLGIVLNDGLLINVNNGKLYSLSPLSDKLIDQLKETRQFNPLNIQELSFAPRTRKEIENRKVIHLENGEMKPHLIFSRNFLNSRCHLVSIIEDSEFREHHSASLGAFRSLLLSLAAVVAIMIVSTITLSQKHKKLQELSQIYYNRIDEMLEATEEERDQ